MDLYKVESTQQKPIEKAKLISLSETLTRQFFLSISLPILAGTYNNQYMVLDRSKVKLGHSLDAGALTVVEQIPGLVEYSDQTQTLRRGSSSVLLLFNTFI